MLTEQDWNTLLTSPRAESYFPKLLHSITDKENIHALHEEWKARLQARGCSVHEQAGSSEEEDGTERSEGDDGESGPST